MSDHSKAAADLDRSAAASVLRDTRHRRGSARGLLPPTTLLRRLFVTLLLRLCRGVLVRRGPLLGLVDGRLTRFALTRSLSGRLLAPSRLLRLVLRLLLRLLLGLLAPRLLLRLLLGLLLLLTPAGLPGRRLVP